MTAYAFAHTIVTSSTLEGKLVPPAEPLEVAEPGAHPPLVLESPGRPPSLAIVAGREARVPPLVGMKDPKQRARILHALANHELQAIELFAWAVLAFPETPTAFRRGLIAVLADEQRHFELYCGRLRDHGVEFGDQPVSGHFWNKLEHLSTPVSFVCTMALTFENANLDFAGDYAAAARECGDHATAEVIDQVHADEIRHVRFGGIWLKRFAERPGEPFDAWQAYLEHARYPLGPRRARGPTFDREARRRAGLPDAFIDALAAIEPTRPSGASHRPARAPTNMR